MFSDWLPVFSSGSPPIYSLHQTNSTLFYTPGWLVIVAGTKRASEFRDALLHHAPGEWDIVDEILLRAANAEKIRQAQWDTPYQPVCLTLYLNNTCNLDCIYCFSDPGSVTVSPLRIRAIKSSAELVAKNCNALGCPLTLVIHGGGEPTLHEEQLHTVMDLVEQVADQYQVPLFRYIATNGVMSPDKASRILKRFDLIGLSCDGPPDIQNLQRPLNHNTWKASDRFVRQTAQIVHAIGKPLHIRVTITPTTFPRLAEIATYICSQLAPQEIHIEPVYSGGRSRSESGFKKHQASSYHAAFLNGRAIAQSYRVGWLTSGSRPNEIHGPFCQVFRNVLNLTPEGFATPCFKYTRAAEIEKPGLSLGRWCEEDQIFDLDEDLVNSVRQVLRNERVQCRQCFNQYHCAWLCPDHCLIENNFPEDDFRCRIQSMMTHQLILETADNLLAGVGRTLDIVHGEI